MNYNPVSKDTENESIETKLKMPVLPQKFVPSISLLEFPFALKEDQVAAVEAWMANNYRGTILYSTGTGKTEIAFECAKRLASHHLSVDNKSQAVKTDEAYNSNLFLNDKDTLVVDVDISKQVNNNADTNIYNKAISTSNTPYSFFNILFLVPRISLIAQTINRLISYGIPKEKVGAYFGERKETREIMISTYHSVIRNPLLIRRSDMVIFDEVHLIRDTSKSFIKIFDIVVEDPKRAILGLTATLDEKDFKNSTILAVLPPVKKYTIRKAVKDKRLAKPVIIPIKVSLTASELKEYNVFSTKIKNISNRFKRYDVNSMTNLLKKGGFASGMAKAWFSNIRKRKLLLSYAENKLLEASNVIAHKFPDEKIMVFSETIESIEKLRDLLSSRGIESKIIDAKVKASERQRILDNWGVTFNVLLSVHTLEIGYDVPQVRIEIILATTSNINQIVQRIGRVLRKYEGKDIALIYVVYVPDTKDDNVIEVVNRVVTAENEEINNTQQRDKKKTAKTLIPTLPESQQEIQIPIAQLSKKSKKRTKEAIEEETIEHHNINKKEIQEKRVVKAYGIVEQSLKRESLIVEEKFKQISNSVDNQKLEIVKDDVKSKIRIYKVKSTVDKNKIYFVDLENGSCTCADFIYRHVKCKHILATEIVSV